MASQREAQHLCSRIWIREYVISFLLESSDSSPFAAQQTLSIQDLLQWPLFCGNFSPSPSFLSYGSQSSAHTWLISPIKCVIIFLLKACSFLLSSKLIWPIWKYLQTCQSHTLWPNKSQWEDFIYFLLLQCYNSLVLHTALFCNTVIHCNNKRLETI